MRTKSGIDRADATLRERRPKTPDEAYASLMRLCARAEKSSGDALRLMATWGVEAGERPRVLQRLIDQRFIDDARYASAFVREKTRLSGWGAYKIRTTLQRKGIAAELIEAALAAIDPETTSTRLRAQLERKARTVKYETPYELKNKLLRYGLSLGYGYDAVRETVAELVKNTDDDSCNDLF